jgi:hypothetical protein
LRDRAKKTVFIEFSLKVKPIFQHECFIHNGLLLFKANEVKPESANAMDEIFSIPQCRWLKKLPTQIIDQNDWGIAPEDIRTCKERYSVRNVAKHIRNSVIHYWVTYTPISGEVERLTCKETKNGITTFELEITAKGFRTFLLKFSETMLA